MNASRAGLLALCFSAPALAQLPLPLPMEGDCDPLDPAHCMLPFPSSFYLQDDPGSVSGKRVSIPSAATPANLVDVPGLGLEIGKTVDTTEWNRQDGFSYGTHIVTYVPGLDLHRSWGTQDKAFSGAPNTQGSFDYRDHIADISRYQRADAPIVLLNAATGQRHPFWSELDTHADVSAARRSLILRPARNLEPATRYVVALRHLVDAEGQSIPAGEAFAAYRDGQATDARREQMESVFASLEAAGIERQSLFLAWDFTTASTESITGRAVHMRNLAFAELGDSSMGDGIVQGTAPSFAIEQQEIVDEGEYGRFRRVIGRVSVPNFMDTPQDLLGTGGSDAGDGPAPPLTRLHYANAGDELPSINPQFPQTEFQFTCDVPLDQGPSYPMTYGHGLVGSQGQIQDAQWPRRFGFMPCGADWWGMSTKDLGNIALILADISLFPTLADRVQQGFINFLFLARAATHPEGFASHPCFQSNADCQSPGPSLIRTATPTQTPVFFDGNSQGGIMGPAMMALSPDIDRGILGVPGINYSTLLQRSVDWEGAFGIPNYLAYQDPIERQLVFGLIQMLWDRAEGNGYAHRLVRNPLPDTPPHEVMLQVAFSDHQVTNHAAEVFARTIGAPVMLPGLPQGRHWEEQPYYTQTALYPYQGSALIYWDSGNAPPPNGNIPADEGGDPHSHPRAEPAGGWQEAHFLLTGEMVDVCQGGDYLSAGHPDAGGAFVCQVPQRALGAYQPVGPGKAPAEVAAQRGGTVGLWLLLLGLISCFRPRPRNASRSC
ncbi:MAG: hypothetical protein ACPHCJ_04515 [Oceanococcaceae bacterium]